jgi:hypothetical protein
VNRGAVTPKKLYTGLLLLIAGVLIAGCSGSHAKAANVGPCMLTPAGAKLCGKDARTYCLEDVEGYKEHGCGTVNDAAVLRESKQEHEERVHKRAYEIDQRAFQHLAEIRRRYEQESGGPLP